MSKTTADVDEALQNKKRAWCLTNICTGFINADSTLKLKSVSITSWFSQYDGEGFSTLQTDREEF